MVEAAQPDAEVARLPAPPATPLARVVARSPPDGPLTDANASKPATHQLAASISVEDEACVSIENGRPLPKSPTT